MQNTRPVLSYRDGWKAREAGKGVTANPHQGFTELYFDWADGWKDCDTGIRNKQQEGPQCTT